MLQFLRKKRLEALGMSCGKSRLSAHERPLLIELEEGVMMRAVIVLLAVGALAALCAFGVQQEPLKHLLYALLILSMAIIQPVISDNSTLRRNSRLALFLGVTLLQVGIGVFLQNLVNDGRLEEKLLPVILPYALAPLTLSVLLGSEVALSGCLVGALWWAVLRVANDPLPLLLAITGGIVAVLSTLRVRRRSRLLRAGLYSGLSVMALACLGGVIGPVVQISSRSVDWAWIGISCSAAMGVGIMTAVLVSGSLPVLERVFGITTAISWLEMADLNHPLLRRLSLEAPGTYHHSLAMANLAEACAEKVGANAALCRVSAYFHDIGKLGKPEYFTENMPAGASPHDDLTPTMSALVILSHVKEGVDLALRSKLHRRIVDAVREHHGTTFVEYFYQRARRQELDARAGGLLVNARPGDIPVVCEESYRYPGPKPQTLETVIIGLADAAESSSRSLERPTLQRLEDLVRGILQDRIEDGQYDEAPVTLCQLHSIADTLVSSLAAMHHSRIAYRHRDKTRLQLPQSAT